MAQSPRGVGDFLSLTTFSLPPTTASLSASNGRKDTSHTNEVRHVTIYEPENLKRYATVAPYIPTYIAAVKTDYNVTLDDVITRQQRRVEVGQRQHKDRAQKRNEGMLLDEEDNMSNSDVNHCARFSWERTVEEDERYSLQGTGAGGRSTMSLTNTSTGLLTETATSTWVDDDEYFVQYVKNSAKKKQQQQQQKKKTMAGHQLNGNGGNGMMDTSGGSDVAGEMLRQSDSSSSLPEQRESREGPRWSDVLRNKTSSEGKATQDGTTSSKTTRQNQKSRNNNTHPNNGSQRKKRGAGGGKPSAAFGWQLVEESNNGKRFPRHYNTEKRKRKVAPAAGQCSSLPPQQQQQQSPSKQQQQHVDSSLASGTLLFSKETGKGNHSSSFNAH